MSVDVTDDIMQLFEFFDRGSDGGLTVDDIIGAFRIFNIEIDIEEGMFIIEAFNKPSNLKVTLFIFLFIFLLSHMGRGLLCSSKW